jgi:hypothetical protein
LRSFRVISGLFAFCFWSCYLHSDTGLRVLGNLQTILIPVFLPRQKTTHTHSALGHSTTAGIGDLSMFTGPFSKYKRQNKHFHTIHYYACYITPVRGTQHGLYITDYATRIYHYAYTHHLTIDAFVNPQQRSSTAEDEDRPVALFFFSSFPSFFPPSFQPRHPGWRITRFIHPLRSAVLCQQPLGKSKAFCCLKRRRLFFSLAVLFALCFFLLSLFLVDASSF